MAEEDLKFAQSYLNNLYPSLSSTQPLVLNGPLLGNDTRGRTLTAGLVLINMSLLDSLNPPGPARQADYIQTLAHELMHTQDLKKLGLIDGYKYTNSEPRHEVITNDAIAIANIFRGNDTQCRVKSNKTSSLPSLQ